MKRTKFIGFIVLNFIFISCKGQGASSVTGGSISGIEQPLVKPDTVKALGDNIMLVYQDSRNNYWFGSWEDGLYRIDGKTILHYTASTGLPANRIEEIKEDQAGNIVINTAKGFVRYDGQKFIPLHINKGSSEWKLGPGDLWFRHSWDEQSVYRYDGNALFKLPLPNHPYYNNSYAVYTIYRDSKGNVWFGTNPLGAFRYNGRSIDWISEDDVTELHDGPANGVRSIIEDKDGYFWFNTNFRYKIYEDKNSGKDLKEESNHNFYQREKSIGNLVEASSGDLSEYLSITKDENNHLWMATYMNGVWKYDGIRVTHYPVRKGEEDITVFSIYKDNRGQLWLGTHENGAYKFNGHSFERFSP